MVHIRPEGIEDREAVRRLNELAFGGSVEAKLVDSLRDSLTTFISLVAVEQGDIVGHIFFTPVTIESEGSQFTAFGLGPMAVLPTFQRQGIGKMLVRRGLEECRRIGHDVVVVVGHSEYYLKFGFVPAGTKGLRCEFKVPDEVFMVAELETHALHDRKGTVKYHQSFNTA